MLLTDRFAAYALPCLKEDKLGIGKEGFVTHSLQSSTLLPAI